MEVLGTSLVLPEYFSGSLLPCPNSFTTVVILMRYE
jgi:hypothetical protein